MVAGDHVVATVEAVEARVRVILDGAE